MPNKGLCYNSKVFRLICLLIIPIVFSGYCLQAQDIGPVKIDFEINDFACAVKEDTLFTLFYDASKQEFMYAAIYNDRLIKNEIIDDLHIAGYSGYVIFNYQRHNLDVLSDNRLSTFDMYSGKMIRDVYLVNDIHMGTPVSIARHDDSVVVFYRGYGESKRVIDIDNSLRLYGKHFYCQPLDTGANQLTMIQEGRTSCYGFETISGIDTIFAVWEETRLEYFRWFALGRMPNNVITMSYFTSGEWSEPVTVIKELESDWNGRLVDFCKINNMFHIFFEFTINKSSCEVQYITSQDGKNWSELKKMSGTYPSYHSPFFKDRTLVDNKGVLHYLSDAGDGDSLSYNIYDGKDWMARGVPIPFSSDGSTEVKLFQDNKDQIWAIWIVDPNDRYLTDNPDDGSYILDTMMIITTGDSTKYYTTRRPNPKIKPKPIAVYYRCLGKI
ncbi:MAG: hypothetical protein R3F48_02000 [Candidatus Zixiibacteriota bacterium]